MTCDFQVDDHEVDTETAFLQWKFTDAMAKLIGEARERQHARSKIDPELALETSIIVRIRTDTRH